MNLIKALIFRIKKSEFIKNTLTLASGTTLAQGISILTAPIVYRIYNKVDYGTLGLYLAITGVVGVFSTMQYLQPILLEKEDNDAKEVMWLNIVINVVVTLIVALLIFLFGNHLGKLFGNEDIMPWLYLAPVSIFFSGQGQIFSVWANRKKKYKILSINAILTALLVPIVSISLGLYNNGPLGLFLGLLASHIAPPIVLLIALSKSDDLGIKYFNWSAIKEKARKHKSFPIYTLPSEFINRLTNQLPVFMLSAYAGPAVVGVYNLCVRMLGLPIQLVGAAISQVFQQKATEDYNNTGSFNNIFVKTFKSLLFISIIPLLVILFFGPNLFALFFGETWRESGDFAQLLIFMYLLKLIVSPLSYAFIIKNKLKEDFVIHIWMLLSSFIIFKLGFILNYNYTFLIFIFSINYSLIYIYTFMRSYIFSKNTINHKR